MNPEVPNLQSFGPGQPKRGKPYLLLGVGIVIIVAAVAAFFLLKKGDDGQKADNSKPAASHELKTSFAKAASNYAGNPVYDACGMLTINTVKAHVNNYKSILAKLATDKVSSDPLTLEHAYVDRDIPAALGGDGQPRATGNNPGPRAFLSTFDSTCVYGQGGQGDKKLEFARVSVIQRPTPLSPDFLAYLTSIDAKKQVAGDLDVYPVPPEGDDSFFTVIIAKQDRSLAVMLRTGNKDLAAAGADEIASKMEAAPTGPLEVTYPDPYAKLVNPCSLLSASDFQQFTGKPASALATETLYLTDVNELTITEALHPIVSGVRQCERLEIDRSINDNIAETNVVLRQFRNVTSAKKYVENLKKDEADGLTIKPVADTVSGTDEAYVKAEEDPNPALPVYTFEMRTGAAIITLTIEGDNLRGDASAEAYATRLSAVAKLVVQNYHNQTK